MSAEEATWATLGVRPPPFIPAREDYFYRSAKEEGFRARSAYKLLHVDEIMHVFSGVTRGVDLCAAPGSWSQLLSRELNANARAAAAVLSVPTASTSLSKSSAAASDAAAASGARVVAVDLQEMAPIPGVVCIQGDITTEATAREVIAALGGQRAQLVVCDGAPDVTGLHQIDEFLQSQLLFAALHISTRLLERGGSFVSKLFKGDCMDVLQSQMQLLFETVEIIKPSSSRIRSAEHFVVGKGYRWGAGECPLDTGAGAGANAGVDAGASAGAEGGDGLRSAVLAATRGALALGDLEAVAELRGKLGQGAAQD